MKSDSTTCKVLHITAIDASLRFLLLNQLKSIETAGYMVYTASSPGPDVQMIEESGIQHFAISIQRGIAPIRDLCSLWRLYRLLVRENFAIVHTHTPKPGLLGQMAAKLAGVPVIVNTLHGFYFHDNTNPFARKFYIMLERIAAYCSDGILSQNLEDIQTAIDERICSPEKISYLGNGIDLSQYDPYQFAGEDIQRKRLELGLLEDEFVIGFVGRLAAKRKGFLDFLAAGKELIARNPRTRLLIIGEADRGKPDAVEPEIAKEYGIAEHCLFLGRLPNHEMPLLYKLMDVLVLPSLFEGVPRAVMEAAAMGVPAVVTNVKGNREAVEQNQNGFLTPLGDVDALTDAIFAIMVDSQLARRMGEAGCRMAIERFDEQIVFEKVKAEYARLLQEEGHPVPEPLEGSVTGPAI